MTLPNPGYAEWGSVDWAAVSRERLWTRIDNLDARDVQSVCLAWHHECPDHNYHLMLRLEDAEGELLDLASGDVVLA